MSDIKRYDPVEVGWSGGEMRGSMKMVVDGDYVSYEDHIAAMKELLDASEAVLGISYADQCQECACGHQPEWANLRNVINKFRR